MALTKDEKQKLEHFKDINLSRAQIEVILARPLIKKEWCSLSKDYKAVFTPIAKQAAKAARTLKSASTADTLDVHLKKVFSKAALEAAKYAQRQEKENLRTAEVNYEGVRKLFKHCKSEYEIIKVSQYHSQKFKSEVSNWKITGTVDIFEINLAITELVEKMTENLPPNVKLQVSLANSKNGKINQTKLMDKKDIVNKLSDWTNLFVDYLDMGIGDINFKLLTVTIPKGEGRRVNAIINAHSKRSIIQVKNYDSMCLARSIAVAMSKSYKEKLQNILRGKMTGAEIAEINFKRQQNTRVNEGIISGNEVTNLIQGRKIQTVLAQALHRICKIPVKPEGNDFQDVKLFEGKLDIQIKIFNLESRQIYKGIEKPDKIFILMSTNHFDVITNIAAFTCANESHNKAEDSKCKLCKESTKCDTKAAELTCGKCRKYFYGQGCLENHTKNNKCVEHSYRCEKCYKFFKTKDLKPELHKCNEFFCKNCKLWKIIDHECFMVRKKIKDPNEKYIFYDFETKVTASMKHEVNYCVAQYYNSDEEIFNTLDEFCDWAFDKKHSGYTFIAHYGKGYDFQFVAEWLISRSVKPNIIHNGQKILQLEIKRGYNIRFIDSISFTLMPLKDFPRTFGLKEAKGYFPHKFNTDANQCYVGPYPCRRDYGYDDMKKCDKENFDEWYETTKGKMFNFKEEMKKYCKMDVNILREGCVEYRRLFLEIEKIDPFQYITLASVCNAIYRSTFLPVKTIAIYNEIPSDNYSVKAIKWLKYLSLKEKLNIKHACNGGEATVMAETNFGNKRQKVDGYCEETNTIYQFHGCYFHGCKYCYDEHTVNKVSQYNMKYLLKRTEKIDEAIRAAGYNVVTIWEHEFDSNKEMKSTSLEDWDLVEAPKIRDAFYGGRCEPVKLIHDFARDNSKGRYIDVVSLYPTVMYYDRYPVGYPKKILKPMNYDHSWFGFVHCKVIPPRGLFMPVLPYRQVTNGAHKLVFGLCRTCMASMNLKCKHHTKAKCTTDCRIASCQACKDAHNNLKQNCAQCHALRNTDCAHNDSQRSLIGLWTTIEMERAIEKGYKIDMIYEAWHFENSSTDLWKGYIRKFMKIKLETSPFTGSEAEYRDKARALEIELGKLESNPGLRYIAKICLNSLWGKFGQNPKVRHSEYIDTENDFYKLVLDDKIEQISISFLNDNMVYASYERKDELMKTSYNTNIFIACYTSSWARLRLYDMLDKLGRNVCYCDTDSVVYIENEDTVSAVKDFMGDGLGEWSDELKGNHMEFWCCAQAKDYGYILNDGKHAGKVKGFRINAETETKMTNKQRVDLIKGAVNNVAINYNQFVISNCKIFTKHMVKQWAFKFDKRMIRHISDDEIDTLPYGY